VLHAHDATGREIGRVLWDRVWSLPGVITHAHARVTEVVAQDGRARGVRFLQEDGTNSLAEAPAVLLATGGAGHAYRETTNPPVATGDGVAMAFRAGARVADLEFVQFHPTALSVPGHPRFLLSEALRGEGAQLLNKAAEAFMEHYQPAGDLAPRDRVARAIVRESDRTGAPVYLSMRHLDPQFVHTRFPLISEACRRAGLDLARDRIPVGPAAHYVMGGVQTDLDGRTSVEGLFAAGEVACTGVHGANRLASNSLLEGLVFGARAGRAMRSGTRSWPSFAADDARVQEGGRASTAIRAVATAADVQEIMWSNVGLFRDAAGLTAALAALGPAWVRLEHRVRSGEPLTPDQWRTANLLTTGRLIARAALRRQESRGGHYRQDFPERDDIHWKRRVSDARERS
jgi:L-aspartate oxidase